jgi:hypothetical protein
VQTADVAVRVVPQGGAAAAGTGTIAYQDGVVLYTPTQAEINHTSVVFIAHKADCFSASVTVTTS